MLQNFVICDKKLETCYQGKETIGYRVKIGLPYYRSLPLSCIEDIKLFIDDVEVPTNQLTLDLAGEQYSMSELNRMDIWWDFLEKGYLCMNTMEKIDKGTRKVKVYFNIRVPYLIPVGENFVVNYDVTNAEQMMEVAE